MYLEIYETIERALAAATGIPHPTLTDGGIHADFATAISVKRMEDLTHLFKPKAEIIAEFSTRYEDHIKANHETILSMLQRRPCTAGQISDIFGMHLNEVSKYLGKLIRTDQIREERKNASIYYTAKTGNKVAKSSIQRTKMPKQNWLTKAKRRELLAK